MRLLNLLTLCSCILGSFSLAVAAPKQRPVYAGSDGSTLEFWDRGFYITHFDKDGDYSYDCRRVGNLTDKLHYGQCEGGERFIFTLDPLNPQTIKIGDVIYKECGADRSMCQDIVGPGAE